MPMEVILTFWYFYKLLSGWLSKGLFSKLCVAEPFKILIVDYGYLAGFGFQVSGKEDGKNRTAFPGMKYTKSVYKAFIAIDTHLRNR
jgi:hypothetical protein